MSFVTIIEQDAVEVEQAVVAGAKACLNYVDNVIVTDLIPALEAALLAAIKELGQEAVAALLAATNTPQA